MIKKQIESYFSDVKQFVSKNVWNITFGVIAIVVGVSVGIIMSSSDVSYFKIIPETSDNFVKFVSGSADLSNIFWNNFFVSLVALFVIFVCCTSVYTSFLALIYIGYQTAIFVLQISSIVGVLGGTSLLASLLFMLPINILLVLAILAEYVLCASRTQKAHKSKLKFSSSFDNFFWITFTFIVCCVIVLQIIASFVFPTIFRSIFIISY